MHSKFNHYVLGGETLMSRNSKYPEGDPYINLRKKP